MSLVIFCLLFSSVDYVLVKGEIIWYLSLTIWLISLSIVFSSSIHAVAKDISSFFLSAAWIQKLWYIYTMELVRFFKERGICRLEGHKGVRMQLASLHAEDVPNVLRGCG